MLEEKLQLLEEKVGAILDEMKRLSEENAALQGETGVMRKKAEEADALRDLNAELQEKINELEGQVAAGNTKEQQVRERLRTIIEKIDTLEKIAPPE